MIVLFSPSEGKKTGGSGAAVSKEGLLFPELYERRLEALKLYNDFVSRSDVAALGALFGIKDPEIIARYRTDLFDQPTLKAVERYDGVAYDYLDYATLSADEQLYVDTHTIIFSNLFGPHKGGDALPEYKLKQGEKIGTFAPEVFYKKHFSQALDSYIDNQPLLDLRAGFYNKFYKPSAPFMTLKFIKNGKVVSHWAKAYRGIVLRTLAQQNIETFEGFMKMQIEGLTVKEILKTGNKTEVVYDIMI